MSRGRHSVSHGRHAVSRGHHSASRGRHPSSRGCHRTGPWRAGLAILALGCTGVGGPEADDRSGVAEPTRAERRAQSALEQAEVDAARGELAGAEEHYREALALWPEDPRVLAGLARVRIGQGDLEEAIALDDRARAADGTPLRGLAPRERCTLWLDAARARSASGRADAGSLLDRYAAESACTDATGAAQVRANVFALEAETARSAGDAEAAIDGWRAAVAADPSRFDLEVRLSRALLDEGQRREAVAQLGEALARHPDVLELRLLMLDALGVPEPRVADTP